MKILNLTAVMLVIALGFTTVAEAKKPTITRPPATSKTYEFGKPTQNIKPRFARESIRSDGSKSIVYGQTIDKKTGRIIDKQHGHSVVDKNGKLVYARTAKGKILLDDRKSKNPN
jgi:hypothetical protein